MIDQKCPILNKFHKKKNEKFNFLCPYFLFVIFTNSKVGQAKEVLLGSTHYEDLLPMSKGFALKVMVYEISLIKVCANLDLQGWPYVLGRTETHILEVL